MANHASRRTLAVLTALAVCAGFTEAHAQPPETTETLASLTDLGNLEEIAARAEATLGDRDRDSEYRRFKRWEWFVRPRLYPSGEQFNIAARNWLEYHRWLSLRGEEAGPEDQTGAWTALGPNRWVMGRSGYSAGIGRVNVLAFAGGAMFAGTPSGGLWKSTDSGASWEALTDGLPSLGVSGIAFDPTTSATIYILTGDGDGRNLPSLGILKSADSGKTWFATGLSWPLAQPVYGYKLVIHPSDAKTLYAATTLGVHRSTDGGSTWTLVLSGTTFDLELKPGAPSTLYAATATQIFRSTDGGSTWTQLTSGLPTGGSQRIALAVTAANPQLLYALYGGVPSTGKFVGLYRSTDGGATFTQRSNSPNILGYSSTGDDDNSQASYDLALTASSSDANQIHSGGINTWKSNDGGATWINTSYWYEPDAGAQYNHADIHALEFQDGTLFCGSDGGIFRTADAGTSWASISTNLQVMQPYRACLGGGSLFLGAQDNGSNQLAGEVATQVYGADGGQCQIDPRNANLVYVTSQEGNVLKSTDGGATLRSVTPSGAGPGAWVTPYVMHPSDAQTLFAGYTDVWKTSDGAVTWSNLSNGTIGGGTCLQVAVAPSNTSVLYVLKSGAVYASTDGGATWSNKTGSLPVASAALTDLAVSPQNASLLWVSFSGYSQGTKAFKSSDGGTTWSNVSAGLPNLPASAVAAQAGNNGVYVGMDVGVFYRDDTLSGWIPFHNGLPNVIMDDLQIDAAASQLYAASFGRGVWKSPLASACPAAITLTNTSPKPVGITAYRASSSISSAVTMAGGLTTDVVYQAGSQISLQPGFQVGAGGTFKATIAPCTQAVAPPATFQPTAFRGDVEAMFGPH